MATTELTVSANIAGLREQLAKIPDIGGDAAAKMTAQLEKSFKRAEAAAKRSADETKKAMASQQKAMKAAEEAAKDLETQAGKVGEGAGKLAGALDMLVPGLGSAAQGVADVSDTLEVFGSSLGLTTVATGGLVSVLAAVTAAYAIYNTSVQNAAALEEIRAQSIDRVTAALRKQTDADISIQVLEGDITETQAERLRIEEERQRQMKELEDATLSKIRANQEEIRTNEAIAGSLGFVSYGLLESAQSMGLLGKSTTQLARENAELEKAYKQGAAAISAASEREDALAVKRDEVKQKTEEQKGAEERRTKATNSASEADRAAAEALRARNEAYRESLALMEEESRAAEQTRGIIERLEEATSSRARAALEGVDAVNAAAEQELARTLKLYQEGTAAAGARNDLQLQLTAAYLAEVESIEGEAYAKREELRRKDSEAEKAAAEKAAELRKELATQGVAYAVSALEDNATQQASILEKLQSQLQSNEENMTVAQQAEAKKRIELQRVAARKAFEITKAAKLAEATISVATAVTGALATPPAPNLLAAGVAGAAGAVQLAAIAAQAPAFHSGGLLGGAPDEVGARLVRGEAVLSRAGRNVVGDEAINAANAGVAPPVRVVAVNQYRHQIFRPFIRDHLKLGGDLADAIRGTRTVGMREAF